MKKSLSFLASGALVLSGLATVFAQEAINVVTREEGSGTRSAFVEIVGVENEDGDDMTTQTAVVQNGTNAVMQTVAGNPNAIGYISLGSLDDSVKAVNVDGVEATADNIKAGDYPIARPFNVAWDSEAGLSDVAEDFLKFIHSAEGQAIAEEAGYIAVDYPEALAGGEAVEELPSYEAAGLEGTIEVVGSTSVSPVIELIAEEYKALNEGVEINVTSNGSSAGMEAAINGTADLGMASRDLSDEEQESLDFSAIAMDGIAVIVNKENPVEDLSLDAIRGIFLGEVTTWDEAQ